MSAPEIDLHVAVCFACFTPAMCDAFGEHRRAPTDDVEREALVLARQAVIADLGAPPSSTPCASCAAFVIADLCAPALAEGGAS